MRLPFAGGPEASAGPAALAVLLTLADGDTPIWLDAPAPGLAAYLRFHTGAPIVGDPAAAQFALITAARNYRSLAAFNPGIEDYPERSATVILEVDGIAESGPVGLRGPGIPDRRDLSILGLPQDFGTHWAENLARFPCGVDLILTCGASLVGLPRGITLELPCM
jgi:alpha-D-ribose 1-methylphosphonate 5-triphosphate synthase subunit PhnH